MTKAESFSSSDCCNRCGSSLSKSAAHSSPGLMASAPAFGLGSKVPASSNENAFSKLAKKSHQPPAFGMLQQMQRLANAAEPTQNSGIPQELQLELRNNMKMEMEMQLAMQAQQAPASSQQGTAASHASMAQPAPLLASSAAGRAATVNEKSNNLRAASTDNDDESDHHATAATAEGEALKRAEKHDAKQCQSCDWKICSACNTRAALRHAAFGATEPRAGSLGSVVQREATEVPFFFPVSICVLNAGTAAEARGGDVCQLGVVAWNQPSVSCCVHKLLPLTRVWCFLAQPLLCALLHTIFCVRAAHSPRQRRQKLSSASLRVCWIPCDSALCSAASKACSKQAIGLRVSPTAAGLASCSRLSRGNVCVCARPRGGM